MERYDRTVSNGIGPGRGWKDLSGSGQHGGIRLFRVFWNRELFEQAGISRFPETWEEFWKCCEKLKAAGITPLALHTEGTAWAAMLLATAEVAGSEEGAAFMKQLYPDTYQNEPGLEIAGTLKKLFQYTTRGCIT